jgi:hypothetical protein
LGLPAIELTELAVPGHLGQAAGFTSSDFYQIVVESFIVEAHKRRKQHKEMNKQECLRANFVPLTFLYNNRLQAATTNKN